MKKPEKKEVYNPTDEQVGNGAYYDLREILGYNLACDDWEKWLPSEDEILNILRDTDYMKYSSITEDREVDEVEIAQAIAKRLGKQ